MIPRSTEWKEYAAKYGPTTNSQVSALIEDAHQHLEKLGAQWEFTRWKFTKYVRPQDKDFDSSLLVSTFNYTYQPAPILADNNKVKQIMEELEKERRDHEDLLKEMGFSYNTERGYTYNG